MDYQMSPWIFAFLINEAIAIPVCQNLNDYNFWRKRRPLETTLKGTVVPCTFGAGECMILTDLNSLARTKLSQ